MERVIAINLNGVAYQLDESAFEALRAYLDRAVAALASNPDKDEIIRDLEQAIADKCRIYLSPSKNVVSSTEMAKILEEMGPVEGEGGEAEDPAGEAPPRMETERPRKRLYRLREGAVISGVCSGMAAYFDLDANIIRLAWIIVALFTSGAAVLVYVVLMFVIPSAHTSEEWAEAHGVPFNAQGVIDEAKRRYAEFEAKGGLRQYWREQRRQWREWRRQYGPIFFHATYGRAPEEHRWNWSAPPAKPAGYVTRFFAGLVALVFSITGAVLTIAFILALISLATTGAVFGNEPPLGLPLWADIVVLCIVFAALSGPIAAIRHASEATVRGQPTGHNGWHALVTIALIALAAWFAWNNIPAAREWLENLPALLSATGLQVNF
jgi:phage shock protein PspC (stress-responsive transcriptional regulator)